MKIKDNDANVYKPGSWLLACDRCGVIVHRGQIKRQHDGFYCCDSSVNDCYEEYLEIDKPRRAKSEFPISSAAPQDPHGFTSHSTVTSDGVIIPDPSQL